MKQYLNSQKYSECQLVTAINASIFLREPGVDPDSDEYERLVDLVSARSGAAISIGKAIAYLRLVREDIPFRLSSLRKALREGCPVGASVWHRKIGFHSVLVTGISGRHLIVQNFRHGTDKHKRLAWAELVAMRRRVTGLRRMDNFKFYVDPWHLRQKVWDLYNELNPAPRMEYANDWFEKPREVFGGLTAHDMCIEKGDPGRVSKFLRAKAGRWSRAG